ncbi:MAG: ABC transporter permease [Bacteroidales bacterium]|nr:ABC transporter permease [Bacteroidales bacterium]
MFWNHIKISLRKIISDKIFSIIKILSLAISLACSILIFLWINHELSYDKFHPNYKRTYRVLQEFTQGKESTIYAPVCGPAGAGIKEKHPQVEYSARTYVWGNRLFKYEDKSFYESKMIISEPDLLKIFKIRFIKGNPDDALVRPNTILVTQGATKKYFGEEDPIGKLIHVNTRDYEITGIIEDCVDNSILQYEFIASLATWKDWHELNANWFNTMFFTYITLKPNIDFERFEAGLDTIAYHYEGQRMRDNGFSIRFFVEPLADIHLNEPYRLDENIHGNNIYIFIFSIIGIFILIIGSVNFMNLSTSKNINNFKEIAIRKILGGTKKVVISQFLIESVILSFIALNIALYIIELVQTTFNNLVDKDLNIEYLSNWWTLPGLIVFGILIGLLSGSYPAIYLSIVKPIDAFRNEKRKGSFSSIVRKVLVIIQFAISIALIIASFIIYTQVNYMKNKKLGFNKSNKLILPIRGSISVEENYEEIKKEFISNTNVKDISVSSTSIGHSIGNFSAHLPREQDNKSQSMYYMFVDDNFISQFDIKLIGGRNFDKTIITDISSWEQREYGSYILNKSALKSFGWSNPEEAIGHEIVTGLGGRILKVIGVVEDFHFMGLQNKIEPLILEFFPDQFSTLNLTINDGDISASVKTIEKKWNELYPDNPFYYYFLDDDFNKLYNEEEKAGKLILIFTFLGIFIACLGLYGLTLYSAEKRTKEIGIKKVLGASISKIVLNMSSGFMWLVLISNILAWPLVYLFMNKWLMNFSYRIDMPYWIYFIAGLITLLIAQLTISIHAVIAANKNPVEALRYE